MGKLRPNHYPDLHDRRARANDGQGGVLVDDRGRDPGGLEAGPNEVSLRTAEGSENGNRFHDRMLRAGGSASKECFGIVLGAPASYSRPNQLT